MNVLAHDRRPAAHREASGIWAALVVLILLVAAVWGAWRLGVMAGEGAAWRERLPRVPAMLKKVPSPQPPPLPTQRRPGVEPALRE